MIVKNKFGKSIFNSKYLFLYYLLFIFILIAIGSNAQEVKYCADSVSICSVFASGTGEAGAGTVDNCADGTSSALGHVKNLTIADQNNSKFYINDVVEIYGLFRCSAANDGFKMAFVYNYGNYSLNGGALENWTNVFNADCDANADVEHTKNITLANVVGNHTIRGLITYKYFASEGCSVPSDVVCGSDHSDAADCRASKWSDTDDITFFVLDDQNPNVSIKYPTNDSWVATTPIDFNFTATDNRDAIKNCTLYTNFTGNFLANESIFSPANNSLQNISVSPSDGNYVWNVQCFDNSSNFNWSVANYTVNVDTTFPKVEFVGLTPANNTFQSSRTVTINVSINESNNNTIILNWDGINSTTLLDNADGIFWNITNTSLNGSHSFYVFVNDTAGNENTTETRNITIDFTPPTNVTLIAPANGSVAITTENLSPFLNWTDTVELNFQNYTIQFSNQSNFSTINRTFLVTTNVSDSSFQITENLANNVTWYWRVIAYDKAGNFNTSNMTFIFITNTSDPSVILKYPPDNHIDNVGNFFFNYTASDDDLDKCELVANFSGIWTVNQTDNDPVSGAVSNFTNVTLTDGIYIWNVNCTDLSEFTAFAPNNFTLTVDLTFPKVEFVDPTPSNNTAQTSTTVVINVSINESSIDKIILNFNGTNETNTLSNPFGIYWNITKSSLDGTYDIYIFVNDTAGNSNTTITRTFTVDLIAPNIINESVSPSAANNNSIFNITAVIIDNFRVNSTIAELEPPNGSKQNLTMNLSSGDIYFVIYNGTTNGTFFVIIYANDTLSNERQSSKFNFTVDTTQPVITNINYTPSSIDNVDPNVSINISATVTDNVLVDTVLILYRKDTDTIWTNTTASNVSSLYWGNFTPNSEANWSFAVWANDTSGNINMSANTTIEVTFDFTWNISNNTLGVIGGIKGKSNVVLGNITINNTGDFNLTFNLSKKSGVPTVTFNISAGGINVSNHSTEDVQILADAPSTAATYIIEVYVNSTNESATPRSRVVNVTFSVTEGGPFLFLQIIKSDSSVTTSAETELSAKLTNTGNETCTEGFAEWTLPSDWKILAGLTGEKNISLGELAIGESSNHDITVQVGTSTGSKTITIAGNCSNGGINDTLSQSVTVSSSGTTTTTTTTGGGGGGGGGGAGAITNVKSSETSVFTNIPAGSSVSIDIDKSDIAVTKLTINVNKEIKSAQLKVSSLRSKPVTQAAASSVYQYLEVTNTNIAEADADRITIRFRIPKTWLSDNGLLSQDMSLYRYEQQWNELNTKIVSSDDIYIFYEADSPGFSFFAIGTKPGIAPGISLIVDEIIEIVRGQSDSFLANITNNKINTTLIDLKLRVEGFPATQIDILPEFISNIFFNETKSFNITINVPSYLGEKKYPLKLLVTGKRRINEELEDISPFKNITLLVFKTLRSQVEYCLIEAQKELKDMKLKDFNLEKVDDLFNDAKGALNEFKYSEAKEICDNVRSLNAKAIKGNNDIKGLTNRIKELKDKGFDMSSAEAALQLAIEAFNEGDFEKADNLFQETKFIVALQVKAQEASILGRLKRLIINYWWALILTALLISGVSLFVYNRYSIASLKSKLKDLNNEGSSLLELIKKAQAEYFTDKTLSKGLYDRYMDKYTERLAKVKQEIISLRARTIGMLKLSQNLEDLEKEKTKINDLMKDLQMKYFEEKSIDKKFYDKIMLEYKKRVAEIDKKIFLLKEKEKSKEEVPKEDLDKKEPKQKEKLGKIKKYSEKLYGHNIINKIKVRFEKIKNSLKSVSKKEEDNSKEIHDLLDDLTKRKDEPKPTLLSKKQIEPTKNEIIVREKEKYSQHQLKKSIINTLKDKFRLKKQDEEKIRKKESKKEHIKGHRKDYREDSEKLKGFGFKIKPHIISKSTATKHNILRHLKEVHKHD